MTLRMSHTADRDGLTLVEVLIVLALIVVLVSVSMPLLGTMLASQRLLKSGDQIRTEWSRLRIRSMEEGKIFCCRCALGGNRMLMDRVLDVHFTASLATEQSLDSYTGQTPPTTLEDGGFTGEEQDFILRDPSQASEETGAVFLTLPEGVFFADTLALPDERAAYYIGLSSSGRQVEDENSFEHQEVTDQDARLGESAGADGTTWSAPIFFFPDGTTSTAAVLLKNANERCVEIRLRGLTATATRGETVTAADYTGEMNAATTAITP